MTAKNESSTNQNSAYNAFAGVEGIVDMYKKNLEVMSLVNQMSIEVYKSITKLQTTFMQQMLTDACNECSIREPGKTMEKFSELAKANMEKAMENSKKISELVSAAGGDVASILTKRFKESVEEVKTACKCKN